MRLTQESIPTFEYVVLQTSTNDPATSKVARESRKGKDFSQARASNGESLAHFQRVKLRVV